jgi:hypothetical protein
MVIEGVGEEEEAATCGGAGPGRLLVVSRISVGVLLRVVGQAGEGVGDPHREVAVHEALRVAVLLPLAPALLLVADGPRDGRVPGLRRCFRPLLLLLRPRRLLVDPLAPVVRARAAAAAALRLRGAGPRLARPESGIGSALAQEGGKRREEGREGIVGKEKSL